MATSQVWQEQRVLMTGTRTGDGRYKAKEIDMAVVERLYVAGRLSAKTVGKALGVSHMTILRRLHANGFDINEADNRGENNSHWAGGTFMRDGYVYVLRAGHPLADSHGYVNRSILAWEQANGVPFPEGKEPHHKNLVRNDDRPENIEPLTHAYHAELHAELRRTAVKC